MCAFVEDKELQAKPRADLTPEEESVFLGEATVNSLSKFKDVVQEVKLLQDLQDVRVASVPVWTGCVFLRMVLTCVCSGLSSVS